MNSVAMISGRPASGKSALARALIESEPKRFRFFSIVTDCPPNSDDISHPLDKSWSEYQYVSPETFDELEAGGFFVTTNSEEVTNDTDPRFGTLADTIYNCAHFDGCVIVTGRVRHIEGIRGIFQMWKRDVTGIYLHVPEEVLYQRMIRLFSWPHDIEHGLEITADWEQTAERLGYMFVENPDEEGIPRTAMEHTLRILAANSF